MKVENRFFGAMLPLSYIMVMMSCAINETIGAFLRPIDHQIYSYIIDKKKKKSVPAITLVPYGLFKYSTQFKKVFPVSVRRGGVAGERLLPMM